MKKIQLDTNLGTITISALPIIRYVEVMKKLKTLPASFVNKVGSVDMKTLDEQKFIELFPELFDALLPQLIDVLVTATNISKEKLEQLPIVDFVKIVLAVIDVNEYREVFASVKKALSQTQEPKKALQ